MGRNDETKGVRLYSAAFLLLMAAPCQEPNPDFDGASGSGSAEGTTTTQSTTDTGPSTAPGTGSGDGTTSGPPPDTTTGMPPDTTTGPPDGTSTSDGGSTTGCAGMVCGGECVDTQTNNDHCGMCDEKCNPQQTCIDGMCMMN